MADDIVIRLTGQDDISPVLKAIADNLDQLAAQMDAFGASSSGIGDQIASTMDLAANAMRVTGEVAGVSADAMTRLGLALREIGASANAADVEMAAAAIDFQAMMVAMTARSGDVAAAFGMTDDALRRMAASFPFLAEQVDLADVALAGARTAANEFTVDTGEITKSVEEEAAGLSDVAEKLFVFGDSTLTGAARTAALRDAIGKVAESAGALGFDLGNLDSQYQAAMDATTGMSATQKVLGDSFDIVRGDIADTLTGIGDLTAGLDRASASGRLSQETLSQLNDVISGGLSISEEQAGTGFSLLAAGIAQGSDLGITKVKELADSFTAFSDAVGGDEQAITIWRAALADGSVDLQTLDALSSGLAQRMAVLRQGITDATGATINLGSASGDLAIREAAVNETFAAASKINQDFANSYIEVAGKIREFFDSYQALRTQLQLGSQATLEAITPIRDMGAAFQATADQIKAGVDQEMVALTGFFAQLQQAKAALGADTGAMDLFRSALGEGSLTLRDADAVVAGLSDKLKQLAAQLSVASGAGIDFANAAGRDMLEQAAVNGEFAKTIGVTQEMAAEFIAAANALGILKAQLIDARASVSGLTMEEKAAAAGAQAVADESAWTKVTAGIDGAAQSAQLASGRFSGLRNVGAGLIDTLSNQAFNLLLVATAFGSVGMSAIKSGVDFQNQIAIIQSLSANAQDLANNGIGRITRDLIADAPIWGQTPAALAQGLYYIESAGFHGADANNVLKYSAYGASGGLGSMKDVASAVTTILDDYGLKGTQAANVTGLLIDATIAGKTTIEDLSKNLGKVVPTSALAKYSFLDTATALDVMTRSGINMNQAATYLRATEQQLGLHSNNVATAAAKMGVNIDGATLTMMAQNDHGDALAKQLQYIGNQVMITADNMGLKGAAKVAFFNNAMLTLTGGIRSGTGAIAIGSQNFALFYKTLGETEGRMAKGDASQAIQDHFNQISQTINFAMMQAKASFAAFGAQFVITFGPQIYAVIEKFAVALANATQWMANNGQKAQGMFKLLGTVLATFAGSTLVATALHFMKIGEMLRQMDGPAMKAVDIFGHLGNKAMNLKTHLPMVGDGASGLIGLFQKLAVNGGNLGTIMTGPLTGGLRVVGRAILHPQMALKALSEGLVKVGLHASLLHAILMDRLGEGLRLAGVAFMHPSLMLDIFKGKIGSLISLIPKPVELLHMLGGGFVSLLKGGVSLIPTLASLGMSFASVALPILLVAGVIAILVIAFVKFRPQVMAAFSVLQTSVAPIIHDVVGMILLAAKQVQTEWAAVAPKIMPAMHQLITAFSQMGPVITVVGTVFKIVIAIILGALGGLVNGFIHALPFIIGLFTNLIQLITNISMVIIAIFTGKWGMIPGLLKSIFGNLKNIVVNALGAVLAFVGGAIQGIIGWFNKLTGGALNGVVSFVNGILHWFQGLFDKLVGHSIIPDMVNAIVRWILSLPGKALGAIAGFVSAIVGGMTKMATQAGQAVLGFVTHTVSTVTQLPAQVLPHVAQMAQGIITKAAGLPGPVGAAFAALANIMGAKTQLAQATTAMHMDQMKAHSLASAAETQMGVAAHLNQEAAEAQVAAMHTKDPVVRAHLEMKVQALEHAAQLHREAAQHLMQMANEAAQHAAAERDRVVAAHNTMKGGVLGAVQSMGAAALGSIAGTAAGFIGHVVSLAGTVVGKFASLPGQIVGALGGLAGALAGVASNAMSAMGNAISGAAGKLAGAAKNVVGGIISGAKSMLGIASPSKVFLEIGHNTSEGMALGIANGASKVNAAARSAFSAGNMPVGKLGAAGVGAGAALGYVPGTTGAGGGGGAMTVTINLNGGLGEGIRLMSPADRARLAQQIGKEMSLATGMQGIQPMGYSGRGTI